MGTNTKIEWTDATWNPIIGCSRVSEGCRNCYAETIAGRFGGGKETVYSGLTHIVNGRAVWTGQIKETRQLLQPLSWRTSKRVFVNSMSDLFHENVTDEQRDRIFAVMALCPQHTFQVLTKRPERMLSYIKSRRGHASGYLAALNNREWFPVKALKRSLLNEGELYPLMPLPNVWLGVSTEDQATADKRIPLLLQTPAAVRFISAEPLLGGINLNRLPHGDESEIDSLRGMIVHTPQHCSIKPEPFGVGIDWVIVGGESGPGARPMHPDWARSLRDQCQAAGVPFFFKQWGAWVAYIDREKDDPDWPLDYSRRYADEGRTRWLNLEGGRGFHGERFHVMRRLGKSLTGALLDGREWKQFPEARP